MAKKKLRGTPPRRAKRKPAPKKALVPAPRHREVTGQVVEDPAPERLVNDGIMLGELGLVELKLSPAEEKVLSEPVDESKVMIRPDGIAYLPHAEYTRWFNRAFGRCGWSIVPVGKATTSGRSVVIPYVLYVHRTPVALAMGEQDYFDNNAGQTYGDAIESTVASGLRRCAKRLGVGLELWDRDWLRRWQAVHAIPVKVRKKKRTRDMNAAPEYYMATEWRKPTDPPLPFEKGAGRVEDDGEGHGPADWVRGPSEPQQPRQGRRQPRQENRPEPDAGTHAHAGDDVTPQQRARLNTLIGNSGRDEAEVLQWLKQAYGYDHTGQVKRAEYERVCKAVEAQGSLPRGRA